MVKNFLFHRVSPQRDILWDPMDVALFDKCIEYITTHYQVMLLEDLVSQPSEVTSKKKLATIVFDDGYKDNIEYALPILQKYKVKASFYVVTDCIDKNIPTWTHMLDHSFQFTQKNKIDIPFNFLPRELRITKLDTKALRINYVKKLKPALKKITHVERKAVMDTVLSSFNDISVPGLMMNWEDLRQLKNEGHYIGSHTVTHCMLGTISDEKEVHKELFESGNRIKSQLGYFPVTISYPVGSYNQTTMRLSKEVGYKIGLAVKQEIYNPLVHDSFEIPRIELYNEPWLKTLLRIENVIGNISKLIRRR